MRFLTVKPSVLPSLFLKDQKIRLGILFSNTLDLLSTFNAGDHVSQTYDTTGNILFYNSTDKLQWEPSDRSECKRRGFLKTCRSKDLTCVPRQFKSNIALATHDSRHDPL